MKPIGRITVITLLLCLGIAARAHAIRACADCQDGSSAVSSVPGFSCDDLQTRMCEDARGITPGTFVCPCVAGKAERKCQKAIGNVATKFAFQKMKRFAKCLDQELKGKPCDPIPKVELELAKFEKKILDACQDADLRRLEPGGCAERATQDPEIPIELLPLQLVSCLGNTHIRCTDDLTRAQYGGPGMCVFTCGDGTTHCGNTATAAWCDIRASRTCRDPSVTGTFDPTKACPADCPAGSQIECD